MQGKTPVIAAVTIGQSPGPDIVGEIALFAPGATVSVLCAPPYAETDFPALGRRAAECGDLVAMDCIGYSLTQRTAVAGASGLPTVRARSVAGRVLAEILGLHPGRG